MGYNKTSSYNAFVNTLSRWRREAAESGHNKQRIKGTAFEEVCKVFLTHDPEYRQYYSSPMTWKEWAEGREGFDKSDDGIDLVAKIAGQDGWCAIQCKFYDQGKRLQSADLKNFWELSGKNPFTHRLIIDTAEDWSRKVKDLIEGQTKSVSRISADVLARSQIDWEKYLIRKEVEVVRTPKTPYDYQQDAIRDVVAGLREQDTRGKMIMACGTGKTYVSLQIAKELVGKGGRVLYLVPSLALMSQTIREWHMDNQQLILRSYAVCSDSQVGRRRHSNADLIDLPASDLVIPPHTNAGSLAMQASGVDRNAMTVIFATYQSIDVIKEAQADHRLPDFDLAICDEAHRTAVVSQRKGKDTLFAKIHKQENVRTHRRLYMTATPRVYAESVRDRAGKKNEDLCSMDKEDPFGPVLYEFGFPDALDKGVLANFEVVVLTIPEAGVARAMGSKKYSNTLPLDTTGKLIGCWQALAKADVGEFLMDTRPMRSAIAYCQNIELSEALVRDWEPAVEAYRTMAGAPDSEWMEHKLELKHVDGTFRADERNKSLAWLAEPPENFCHVLSNVRCLSEGVDVPALDAILFMNPRESQIEVVQAVGRVMRRFEGKKTGYVILPVVAPQGTDPASILDRNKRYEVIWKVINALRSHDSGLDAEVNLLDTGQEGKRLRFVFLSDWKPAGERTGNGSGTGNGEEWWQGEIKFEYDYIRAKIVEKCTNRKSWSEWAGNVAEIAQAHVVRITEMVGRHEAAREVFEIFLAELRDDLNGGITKKDAIEMLAQHMVTRPVFEALLGNARFVDHNPISKGMQTMLDVLSPEDFEAESRGLEDFYEDVRLRAAQAVSGAAKQRVIKKLYEEFFTGAFKKTAARLGIVYTPIELVDFVLHSVDQLLRDEFGKSFSSEGIGILDPFTGTGTFITRMIQNGLIDPEQLPKKYRSGIHANEIMLLAYYIAAVNIEAAYHEMIEPEEYERFAGIVLTDTFDMQYREDEIAELMQDNSEQRKRQKEAKIWAVVGNPPWSKGQRSENDDARNQSYPKLDQRIDDTYASFSVATNKNSLYDSYILAIRWASDRIGERGVIGFVTNAG